MWIYLHFSTYSHPVSQAQIGKEAVSCCSVCISGFFIKQKSIIDTSVGLCLELKFDSIDQGVCFMPIHAVLWVPKPDNGQ